MEPMPSSFARAAAAGASVSARFGHNERLGKGTMFAVVRTGGKQYRVAAGDKIAVEKLAGEAGDKITLSDVLIAGEDGNVADASKVSVSAEIIAQDRAEKVTIFKKRRRHNYRRKLGHRQSITLLRILAVGAE